MMEIFLGQQAITLTPEEMAHALARTDNIEQAVFFNEFNKQIRLVCGENISDYGFQLIMILKELDLETEAMFAHLHREIENKLT